LALTGLFTLHEAQTTIKRQISRGSIPVTIAHEHIHAFLDRVFELVSILPPETQVDVLEKINWMQAIEKSNLKEKPIIIGRISNFRPRCHDQSEQHPADMKGDEYKKDGPSGQWQVTLHIDSPYATQQIEDGFLRGVSFTITREKSSNRVFASELTLTSEPAFPECIILTEER